MEASGTDSHFFMLSTFRDRHPLGSVVTDLLRVEEGIYVVKAQISVGGIVLGSGMAGSTTVEEAEDAAIQRALRISGISNTSSLLGGSALGTSSLDSVSLGATNGNSGNSMSSSFELDSAPLSDTTHLSPSSSASEPNGFSSVDDWDAPPSVPEPASSKPRKAAKPTPSKAKSKPEPEPEPQLEPEIEDLSELIAQTDVELTRIGWGPKEGRRFLKERFSKQSRQQLDEAELRDFLQELKLQPTKMLDAAEF